MPNVLFGDAQPTMHSGRLILRPLQPDDASALQRLAGSPEIAATTLQIPHPYPPGTAERFIAEQTALFNQRDGACFAVAEGESGELCGCVGLGCDYENRHAELGYWIGVPYWGRGYATEAVRCVVAFGFGYFRLNRIYARHFVSNPASGRVLEKVGFLREGVRREHILKAGRGFEDIVDYGILLREWAEIAHR